MPLYQWTLTEPGPHDKGIGEEATKPTKGIRDASPHLGKEEDRNLTDLLTETPHQEEHASNAGKWDILPGTAQGGRKRKALISSTTANAMSQSTCLRPPYQEPRWPRGRNN